MRPHMPQWFGFIVVSMQPPPQQVRPIAAHELVAPQRHSPAVQVSSPVHAGAHEGVTQVLSSQTWPASQRIPHAPQSVAVEVGSTQRPPQHTSRPEHISLPPHRHAPAAHESA